MNKIFKVLTLVLIMTLCIGVIFTFVGCKDDKPENELQSISVIIGEGEDKLILSVDNANEDAIRSAISVTASFSGNDIAEIIEQYEIVGFDANAEGEQTVTIKYNGFEQSIKVVINRPQAPTLSSIKIDKASIVLSESEATEDVLKSKIEVKAVYSDGSETAISDYSIEGFKADAEGEQTVTVKYSTVNATIKVTVEHPVLPQEPTLESIKVAPESLTIAEADASVDAIKGKIVVTAVYSDKSEKIVSDYTVDGFNADAEGEQNVTIKYSTVSAVIKVTIERPTEPEQIKIYVNTDTEGKVLNESTSGDENVVKQYSITIELEGGDLVKISAGKIKYNEYDVDCGFKGVASIKGEYTFYVKLYQDGTHSIWVGVPTSVDPDVPVTGDTITIYYYNVKGWANVNAYAWVSGTEGTGWPGQPMTEVEGHDNWYQAEVSSEKNRILFNAGDQMPKTLDLVIDTNKLYYNGYEWTDGYNVYDGPLSHTIYYYNTNKWSVVNAYAWVGDDTNEAWPGKPMEAVADHDGWHSIEIGIEYKYIQFNGGTDFTKTDDIDINENLYYYNEGWVSGFGESVVPTPNPDVPTITENSEVYLVIGDTKTKLVINEEAGEGKLEFMIEKIALDANSTFTITVDGKEYANYKDKSPVEGSVEEAGKYSIYVSNDGIWADKAKEESDPTAPTITKESVVKLLIGEKETSFVINEKASEGVIEFMIEKIELEANSTFTITVDGQEYANYKEESLKGSVTEAGDYCFYVSNAGIYVALYTPPYTVSISINDGEPMVMTESQSTLDDVKVEYKATVELNKDDKVTIKDSKGVIFSKYEKEDVFNGIAVAGGKYTFYVKEYIDSRENLIYVEVETSGDPDTPDIPQEPTLESIKVNKTELTIEKANANIEYIKEQITVTAVYSNNSEETISEYEISELNADNYEAQTLTISYEGKTAELKVTIQKPEPTISSIEVNEKSITLSESEATVDGIKSKIEVKAVYSDSSEKAVSDYTVEDFNAEAEDEQTVTIKYLDFTATIKVTVKHNDVTPDPTPDIPQEPTLESIKVAPESLTIAEADASIEIIKEQITVTAVYSNKSETEVTGYSISGLNADSYEAQTLTISYEGKSAELKVTIQKPTPVISSIKVDKASIVLSESEATVDGIKSKIEVKAVYSDSSEKAVSDYTVEDFNADADGEQTVTIKYVTFSATIKVTVEHPVTKYYVYLNDASTEMEENPKAQQEEGKKAEYMASISLNVGDVITVKDSSGISYSEYTNEDFSGTAKIQGSYIVYLKVYEDCCTIWVGVPSVELTKESEVKIVIGDKEHILTLNEANTDIEYKLLNVAVTTEDVIKVYIGKAETANYKPNATIANGHIPENGNYNFYVDDKGIWVEKAQESTTPAGPTLTENSKVILTIKSGAESKEYDLVRNENSLSGGIEFMIEDVSITTNDTIVFTIDGAVFNTYKNDDLLKDGKVLEDGSYSFYVEGAGIYVAKKGTSSDVPVTGDTMTIYYYNVKGWSNVNAYVWNANGNNVAFPGEAMTKVEGKNGWYSIEVSASYTSIIFSTGENGSIKSADIAIDADKHYFNGYEWTDGYNLYAKTTRTVYFKNTDKWTSVKAYSWENADGSNYNKAWPGEAMTKVDDEGWYSIELSIEYDMIIFYGGDDSHRTQNVNYGVGCIYYDYSVAKDEQDRWVESF